MAQPARERLLEAAATAAFGGMMGAAYGAAQPGAAGEPGPAGRGRRSRARRPGIGGAEAVQQKQRLQALDGEP